MPHNAVAVELMQVLVVCMNTVEELEVAAVEQVEEHDIDDPRSHCCQQACHSCIAVGANEALDTKKTCSKV